MSILNRRWGRTGTQLLVVGQLAPCRPVLYAGRFGITFLKNHETFHQNMIFIHNEHTQILVTLLTLIDELCVLKRHNAQRIPTNQNQAMFT